MKLPKVTIHGTYVSNGSKMHPIGNFRWILKLDADVRFVTAGVHFGTPQPFLTNEVKHHKLKWFSKYFENRRGCLFQNKLWTSNCSWTAFWRPKNREPYSATAYTTSMKWTSASISENTDGTWGKLFQSVMLQVETPRIYIFFLVFHSGFWILYIRDEYPNFLSEASYVPFPPTKLSAGLLHAAYMLSSCRRDVCTAFDSLRKFQRGSWDLYHLIFC